MNTKKPIAKLAKNESTLGITKSSKPTTKKTVAASKKSPIKLFCTFSNNYPAGFIQSVWGKNTSIANHLTSKFSIYYDRYGSRGVMLAFYTNLDGENQKMLETWILKNYKG